MLNPGTVAGLRHALDGLERSTNPYGILRHNLWRSLVGFAAVLAPLAAIARAALGADEVVPLPGQPHLEAARNDGRGPLAPGLRYWPLGSPDGVTLWIALDAANAANGCLE